MTTDIEELRTKFNEFDTDKDGELTFAEFQKFVEELSVSTNTADLRPQFEGINANADTGIGFSEFKAWWGSR